MMRWQTFVSFSPSKFHYPDLSRAHGKEAVTATCRRYAAESAETTLGICTLLSLDIHAVQSINHNRDRLTFPYTRLGNVNLTRQRARLLKGTFLPRHCAGREPPGPGEAQITEIPFPNFQFYPDEKVKYAVPARSTIHSMSCLGYQHFELLSNIADMGDSYRFVDAAAASGNARRIPDDVWEGLKTIILEKYVLENNTLDEVMRYMEEHRGFGATKRQYIHRLEKWGAKKYKTSKPPVTSTPTTGQLTPAREPKSSGKRPQNRQQIPQSSFKILQEESQVLYDDQNIDPLLYQDMSSHTFKYWYSHLAHMLYALGDLQPAFQILARLYEYHPDVSLAVACGRSAEVKIHITHVRDIIEKAINQPEVREKSWIKFIFGAQLARTWDQVGDQDNAFEQFDSLVNKYLDRRTSQHRPMVMVTREPELDVVAYSYLQHLIDQFNNDDWNFEEGEPKLKAERFLENFRDHQPWFSQRTIPCLRGCLDWCLNTMAANPGLAEGVQGILWDPVYKIVCLLWRTWTQDIRLSQASPEWAVKAMEQLRIPAAELLTLVVCMIMSTPIPSARRKGKQNDSADSTVADAILRCRELQKLDGEALVDDFLYQVRRSAKQRMVPRKEKAYLVRSSEFKPVRDFIIACLPEPEYINLPAAHNGYIHPLMVADPASEETARQTPSPPVPGPVDFQHGQSS